MFLRIGTQYTRVQPLVRRGTGWFPILFCSRVLVCTSRCSVLLSVSGFLCVGKLEKSLALSVCSGSSGRFHNPAAFFMPARLCAA